MIEEFLEDIKALGGLPFYVIVILLFAIMAEYPIVFALTFGLIVSYLITITIRMVYFRERPKKVKYKNWIQKIDASSFPSLHTMRAVVLGIIVATTISSPIFSMLAIPCILLVAYARVKLDRHHVSDVVAGLFLGVPVGLVSIWITNLLF